MVLKAFDEAEIAKIYKKKLFYSIIKYNNEIDRLEIENPGRAISQKEIMKEKIQNALRLNNSNIDYHDFDNIVSFLDDEMKKYESVIEENKDTMKLTYDAIIKNIIAYASILDNDVDKCRFLFEYICNNVKPNNNAIEYNDKIPYGSDYPFEFSKKGVPIANIGYEGIIVGKVADNADISNFMEEIGKKIGLDIEYYACEHDDKPYSINAVKIDGNVSYMDPYAVITKRKATSEALLVDRPTLLNDDNYQHIREVGVSIDVDYKKDLELNYEKNAEAKILPEIEYISDGIFEKQK